VLVAPWSFRNDTRIDITIMSLGVVWLVAGHDDRRRWPGWSRSNSWQRDDGESLLIGLMLSSVM
jgi:hypothetical protein